MPKNINAIASTNQIPKLTFHNGINNKNEASIPIPQTLKIILRFFFSGVNSPEDFVNKNNEL